MKIISIDVGIKNCSFCILTKETNNIKNSIENIENDVLMMDRWDIVDLIDASSSFANNQKKKENPDVTAMQCACINANKKRCKKVAVYKKQSNENNQENYYCVAHAKKDRYFAANDLKPASLKKQSLKGLQSLLQKYDIVAPISVKKKSELTDLLGAHHLTHGLFLINVPETKIACDQVPLQIVGRNILSYFDAVPGIRDVTHVIIENQIGPLATKMKTVQGMLMQYFIMRDANVCVEFINASNKLKDLDSVNLTKETKQEKLDYKGRKKQAIAICTNLLSTVPTLACWKDFFYSCKKKDDLSDCFLQGIWYLQKHP